VRRYRGSAEPAEDLMQAGYVGLHQLTTDPAENQVANHNQASAG